MQSAATRRGTRLLSGILLWAACLVGEASAQEILYGLTDAGKLCLNGTVLDSLPTDFESGSDANGQQRWVELIVKGSDRYVLRRDGLLFKNGRKLYTLLYEPAAPAEWVSLAVDGASVYAIRQDGLLANNGKLAAQLPTLKDGVHILFRQVLASGGDVYCLRFDGSVFRNASTTPIYQFTGGNGLGGLGDGREVDTLWVSVALATDDGDLYALRSDGKVRRGVLPIPDGGSGIPTGEDVGKLPFVDTLPLDGDFYLDFEFGANGVWYALRASGQVYSELQKLDPVVTFPGTIADVDRVFLDLATSGDSFWAIRGDGKVYKDTGLDPIIDMPRDGYQRVAVSTEAPDLSRFKNHKPAVAAYQPTVLEGSSLLLPVIASDVDKESADLVVTPVDPLPPGAAWDADERMLTWDPVGPAGSYRFAVTVDDGSGKVATAKYKIKVIAQDAVPEKNRPPAPAKLKPVQALVDRELRLPIFATDADGDDVAIEARTDRYPFTAGATFDAETRTLIWTPSFDDIGKVPVEFQVSDGIATKKFKVSLNVVSSLIFSLF
jgi:hypothetical protein